MNNEHDIAKQQKRSIFLDDIRNPSDAFYYTYNPIYLKNEWIVVRNYEEFINDILVNGLSDIYSFDHDLGFEHYEHQEENIPYDDMEEKTGYHCAKWLVDFCMDNNLELPEYYAHSINTVGRRNIIGYLDNYVKFSKNQNNGK